MISCIALCCCLFSAIVTQTLAHSCVLSQSRPVTLYFAVEHPLPDPNITQPIPAAHTDIAIPLRFSGWDIHYKTDHPAANTRIDADRAVFALGTAHRVAFSDSMSPSFSFIGAAANQTFWHYDQELPPAPGFASQDMSTAEVNALCLWDPNDPPRANGLNRWLRVNLIDVRGPEGGHVSMWQESGQTPRVFFSTFDGGITESDVFYIPARQHVHNSWAFTQPGLYEVDIQVSAYYHCDPALTADYNSDCNVNFDDFAILKSKNEWNW